MKTPYEVLIRNGIHAHLILSPGDAAQPVAEENWPAIAAAINPTALGTLATIEAEHAAALKTLTDERDALKSAFDAYKTTAESALTAAAQAIKNQDLNDKDTVATIATIVAETAKPVVQREIEALQAEKARLEAELATKLAAL